MPFKKFIPIFFSFSILSASLYNHSGPEYDTKPRNALDKAASEIGAPYKLTLISSGLGRLAGADNSRLTPWGLLFTSPEKMTLSQAQEMARDVSRKLLQKMYSDPSFANYSVASLKEYPKGNYPPPSDDSIAFRIDFWDEEVNRPLPPYIAEIRFAEGKFYYYYADAKTQGLESPVLVETFPLQS